MTPLLIKIMNDDPANAEINDYRMKRGDMEINAAVGIDIGNDGIYVHDIDSQIIDDASIIYCNVIKWIVKPTNII